MASLSRQSKRILSGIVIVGLSLPFYGVAYAGTSTCADVRQQSDLAMRFYRDWKAYTTEGQSNLADASRENMQHVLDVASGELDECSDRYSLLQYYRARLYFETDDENVAWAMLGSPNRTLTKYYDTLERYLHQATRLGLQQGYPADYKLFSSRISKYSPEALAKAATASDVADKTESAQAQADLDSMKQQFPVASHVLSVQVKDGAYQYVVEGSFWNAQSDETKNELVTALAHFSLLIYQRAAAGKNPPAPLMVQVNDESGTRLATMLGDDRLDF
jgi:hypothetical protein